MRKVHANVLIVVLVMLLVWFLVWIFALMVLFVYLLLLFVIESCWMRRVCWRAVLEEGTWVAQCMFTSFSTV